MKGPADTPPARLLVHHSMHRSASSSIGGLMSPVGSIVLDRTGTRAWSVPMSLLDPSKEG